MPTIWINSPVVWSLTGSASSNKCHKASRATWAFSSTSNLQQTPFKWQQCCEFSGTCSWTLYFKS